ncbi:DUF6243 family protein [Streptomyces thermolilacinus]|uniref:DUF6243 family protein n=1 Tax=Streptomyces thermolilacinus TaxID=285540 RepID=UPI0003C771B5|nr:DUF6243 family protein [Streptomyces thermolilacinus]
MAKSRNNLLGVGGQRKKLSRLERQGAAPRGGGSAAGAADAKQELLRKMRERTQNQPQS